MTSATPTAALATGGGLPWWWIALGVAALAAVGALMLRRRRVPLIDAVVEAEASPADPADAPSAPPPPVPVRALTPTDETAPLSPAETPPPLVIEFRPLRAGVNLLSATVESEVVITNAGTVVAENVQVEVRMIGAHAGQDADLAAIAREPVTRPAIAPFALQPGDVVRLSAIAALPRAAIVPLDAGGRPIFVPIVTVKLDCAMGDASVRQAVAYAVGVERVDSDRLAPFWLDGPPRTFDTVAARPHPIA